MYARDDVIAYAGFHVAFQRMDNHFFVCLICFDNYRFLYVFSMFYLSILLLKSPAYHDIIVVKRHFIAVFV